MKKRLIFHLQILPVLFFISLLTLSANKTFAQAPESQVKISVQIVETGYHGITDKGKNKLVWKFFKGANPVQDSVLTNGKLESCFLIKSKKNNKVKEISDEKENLRKFEANISGFKITMQAFLNKKGGEKCIPDTKDRYYGIKTEEIPLNKLAAGVWSDEITIQDAFGVFYAVIIYKYELLQGLSIIESSGNSLINDASKNLELSLPIKLPNKETLPFTWSYAIGNEDNWKIIPNSAENKSKIEFNPLKILFADKLAKPMEVKFKAEVVTGGKTESTDPFTLIFAPTPPSFEKEKNMVLIPVCNGLANGGVEIKNIKATASDIKYVLQKKTETNEPCNLKQSSAEVCPGFIENGTVATGKTLRLRNLTAGEYILYLFNGDLESGEVNNATQFTISELPPLKIIDAETSSKEPTCTNVRGGEIYMSVEDAANLWQIAIWPNKGNMTREGNNISFKDLEAGKYTVYLSNQCGPEVNRTFILKKPKQISIDQESISTKQDKTGHYLRFDVKNGSNDYKVKVTDPESMITEKAYLMYIEIPISKTGIYIIEVMDNANPACPAASVSIKMTKSAGKFIPKVIE